MHLEYCYVVVHQLFLDTILFYSILFDIFVLNNVNITNMWLKALKIFDDLELEKVKFKIRWFNILNWIYTEQAQTSND